MYKKINNIVHNKYFKNCKFLKYLRRKNSNNFFKFRGSLFLNKPKIEIAQCNFQRNLIDL